MSSFSTSPASAPFANVLREQTANLHREAERSGVVAEILAGQVTRAGYALLLRNLLPAYEALESGLQAHRNEPGMGGLFRVEVFRAATIRSDLAYLVGAARNEIELIPAGRQYAERIAVAASTSPGLLIAHAYTRYLGDLGGGQILKQLLKSSLNLDDQGLSFYAFPGATNIRDLASSYRSAIDLAATFCGDLDSVIEEARTAFRLNIELSESINVFLQTKGS